MRLIDLDYERQLPFFVLALCLCRGGLARTWLGACIYVSALMALSQFVTLPKVIDLVWLEGRREAMRYFLTNEVFAGTWFVALAGVQWLWW